MTPAAGSGAVSSTHDSSEENLRTLGGWLERYGRPLALYTDKNSLFVTSRPVQWQEQLHETPARTQFGRALAELDIEWIAAQTPQAKGRIERLFGTLQDRLVKEMRLAEIATLEQANRFLEITFWPVLGAALQCGRGAERRRASPGLSAPAPGADSQCAGGAHGRFRPHGELGGPALGRAARRSLRGAARRSGRDRDSGSTAPTGCAFAAATCR